MRQLLTVECDGFVDLWSSDEYRLERVLHDYARDHVESTQELLISSILA
jgi:hypothetical protein